MRCTCVAFTLLAAASAPAQMVFHGVVEPTTFNAASFGSALFYNDSVWHSEYLTDTRLRVRVKGDQAAVLPYSAPAGAAIVGQRVWASFDVLFGPVEITKVRAHGNANLVAGGGTGDQPQTQLITQTYLYEYADRDGVPGYSPSVDSLVAGMGVTTTQWVTHSGQGHWEHFFDSTWTGNRVLASYSHYVMLFDAYAYIYRPEGNPSASVTLEYGGPHAPQYDGFTMDMDYNVLPEPGSIWALGLGLAALVRRRRRLRA